MTTIQLPRSIAVRLPRIRALSLRGYWLEASVFVAFAALYCVYSIRAQLLGRTHSYDLGIFTQGVQGYAQGVGPMSSIKGPGFSLLGDHFSPVTALIAPAFAVFPTPITLLVAQALLVALSAMPITRLFSDWFGRPAAAMAAASYGLSFGVVNAIGFDFHEVAFGAPLLAFAMTCLARRRAIAAAAWTAPLVLVKEDMGFTVAAIGVVLAIVTGRRRLGAGLAAFGLAATFLEVKVLIPAFNSSGQYAYSKQLLGVGGTLHALSSGLDVKAITVLCLVGVTAFVGLRSPLLLIVLPTLAWRFSSPIVNYWGMTFHYGLLLMPVAFVALADGLRRLEASGRMKRSSVARFAAVSLVVSLLLIPTTPFFSLLQRHTWQRTDTEAAVQEAVALVPSGASVAATDTVVPQLVTRTNAWLVYWPDAIKRNPEWVVLDTVSPSFFAPDDRAVRLAFAHRLEAKGWGPVFDEHGVLVLHR